MPRVTNPSALSSVSASTFNTALGAVSDAIGCPASDVKAHDATFRAAGNPGTLKVLKKMKSMDLPFSPPATSTPPPISEIAKSPPAPPFVAVRLTITEVPIIEAVCAGISDSSGAKATSSETLCRVRVDRCLQISSPSPIRPATFPVSANQADFHRGRSTVGRRWW